MKKALRETQTCALAVVRRSQKCSTSVPILDFLGLTVLDLGPTYATDRRQTSDAHHRLNALYPRGGAKINRFTVKKERNRSLLTPFNSNDNNDNDKRLGLTAKADQPDHKNTVH